MKILNPIAATILIRHTYMTDVYKSQEEPTPSEKLAYEHLYKNELITTTISGNIILTPRGRCLVEYWMDTTLPVAKWEVVRDE